MNKKKERERKEEEERKERILKLMRQNPEIFVLQTPYAPNFRIHRNTITLQKQVFDDDDGLIRSQQLLMDVVKRKAFTFTINITKSKGWIRVGVVDREKQRLARSSYFSGNAVCYASYGEQAQMRYGKEEWQKKETDDVLCEGMKLEVKVEGDTVEFKLSKRGWLTTTTKVHTISSPILAHPRPEFVPFIQMWHEGDAVEWQMQ